MTKTETIQAIKAEIEKLIERYGSVKTKGVPQEGYKGGRLIGYEDALNILKRIQEKAEEDTPNDLEEAAENPYVLNNVSHASFEYERTRNDLDARSDNEVVRRAFIAGAKWQKQHDAELIEIAYNDGITIGMTKQKEQMLKEAVEGTVMDFSSNQPRPQVDVLLDPHKYHTGDKVRIIIVKENYPD